MIPTIPRSVAPFDEAFNECFCPTCLVRLVWEPLEGLPHVDSGSEQPVAVWLTSHCGVVWELERVMQRPSDHTTWYGYVTLVRQFNKEAV
jgi:hypothetical protein